MSCFTVFHSGASRRSARSTQDWYADKRALANGDRVSVVKQDVDEHGYEMLYVETPATSGWMYAIEELK